VPYAVLAIVLVHLRIPGSSGGYIGVEIFFVISEFLITGFLVERTGSRNFSCSRFYASTVKRLVLAVVATIMERALRFSVFCSRKCWKPMVQDQLHLQW